MLLIFIRMYFLKVYSTVDNVVILKLISPNAENLPYSRALTVNYELIMKGLAEKSEESYLSQVSMNKNTGRYFIDT